MARSRSAYGDGTIFEKTYPSGRKVWVVEMPIGKKADGRTRKVQKTANTYNDALKLRKQLNAEKLAGRLNTKQNFTLEKYAMWWVREVKPQSIKDSTAADYEDRLRRYVLPYLGKTRLSELQYSQVVDWMNELALAKKGVRTINGARAILNALCKDAQREGILMSNPVGLTKPFKSRMGDKTQVKPHWTKQESQQVLACAKDDPIDLFVHICLFQGLRHGEVLGLSWSAVDLENRTITVKQTLKDERRITKTGDGQVRSRIQEVKTKASNRTLKISEPVYSAFVRHQMRQSNLKMLAGPNWKESGMVFTTQVGTPINMANNLKRFRDFIQRNQLRYIRVHDIRHTYANLALENNVPLESVSQSLGHADIGITKSIYAPNVRGLNDVAIEGVAAYLTDESFVPAGWQISPEEITPLPLQITDPVKVSTRRFQPKLVTGKRLTP